MTKLIAILGFLILALSPSFIDWQQEKDNPRLRQQIVVYYTLGIIFIFVGLDGWITGEHS